MAGRVIGVATVQVKADTTGFSSALKGVGSEFSGMASRIGKVVGALGLTNLAREAISFGSTYTVQLDNARAAITGLTSSQGEADDLMRRMTQFAISTPFDLPGVTNVTTRLLALGKGFGVTSGNVLDYVKTLGDAAAINGKGADSMLNVVNIMGRISGQGRVMTKDMNQLTANFPSLHPWEILSEMTGKTEGELRKLAAKPGGLSGIVDSTAFLDALNKKMQEMPGAAGAMERKMATLGGSFELFKDTIGVALASGLTPFFQALQTGMNSGDIQGQLTAIIGSFSQLASGAMAQLAPILPQIMAGFNGLLQAMLPALPLVGALANAFALALVALQPVIGMLAAVAAGMAMLLNAMPPSLLGAITAALIVLWITGFGPIGLITAAVIGLATIIYQNWDSIVAATQAFADAMVAAWNWFFDAVISPIADFVSTVIGFFQNLYDILVGNSIIPDMVNAIIGWFQTLIDVISSIVGAIRDVVVAVWNAIKTVVTTIVSIIATIIETYFNIYRTIIETYLNIVRVVVETVWNAILAIVTAVVNGVRSVVESVWNAISSATSAAWNAIKAVVTTAVNGVRSVVESVWNAISSFTSAVWNAIKNAVTNPIETAKDIVSGVVNTIKSLMSFSGLSGAVSSAWNAVKTAIIGPIQSAYDTVMGIVGKIKSAVTGAIDAVKSIPGAGVVSGAIGFLTGHAAGGVFTKPHFAAIAEGSRAEAVVPLTNPGRAMQVMQQAGLDRLAAQMGASRGISGPLVSMPGAVIQDATDADLVAQRTLVAIQASMVAVA